MTEQRRFIPWVTITLAVLNVAVFIWEISAGASATEPTPQWMGEHGGNFGPSTLGENEPWRLFTSMFLHYGVLHIVMNMIGLIDGGRHVEKMYGRAGFIALYLVAGLAGSLATALRSTNVVSAGASGAIFGVFGAFGAFLLLHRQRLDAQQVSKQARGLIIFLAYNVYFGMTAKGIDLVAHLGGLAAGFVVGLALEYGTSEDPSTPRRSLIVGVLGIALIFGATQVVHAPGNPIKEFGEIEVVVNARWQQLLESRREDKMTDLQVADAIEKELLPKWHAGREAYERDGEGPAYSNVVKYMRLREDGWTLLVQGVRSSDDDALKRGGEKFEEATRLLESITK